MGTSPHPLAQLTPLSSLIHRPLLGTQGETIHPVVLWVVVLSGTAGVLVADLAHTLTWAVQEPLAAALVYLAKAVTEQAVPQARSVVLLEQSVLAVAVAVGEALTVTEPQVVALLGILVTVVRAETAAVMAALGLIMVAPEVPVAGAPETFTVAQTAAL
jgi:hypothetical protein